jgi:DNA-binding transcriptional LysR family regulator
MELYQFRTFVAVAELGSLTQAAEHLHLSQPACSAQIKTLEEELGLTLFERRPTGLALTRMGAALFPEIQKLLAAAANISAQARTLQGVIAGKIKIATIFDATLARLADVMGMMIKRHPLLDIEVHHRNSRIIVAGVTSGAFDAGVSLGAAEVPNLTRIPLRKLHYRLVAPTHWKHVDAAASWKTIAKLPWISAPEGGSYYQMAFDLFQRQRFKPGKVIETDSEIIIASLIAAGVGVGLMREDLARQMQQSGSVIILNKGRPTTYLQLVFRTERESDPAVRALLNVIGELWPPQS